jgi:hypothetical protein
LSHNVTEEKMRHALAGRLSYANVIATLALFIALGGAAYAATALPRNSVGTRQLKKGAVTAAKIRNGSLLASDFRPGQLPAGTQGASGPVGPVGARGPAGASNVVSRYGTELELQNGQGKGSFAACATGEAVTGGGYEFIEGNPANPSYVVGADRPSLETTPGVHALPADGAKATGWLVAMTNATSLPFKFRAYVQCASP